ncbi:MAG: Gfo/Idh/MocA family protein [Bacillota bacterium]
MKTDSLKIGIIGTGSIAPSHARNFGKIEEAQIIAATDKKEERVKSFVKEYDIKHYFTDYRKMLHLKELDAVIICLPNYLHSTVAMEAMKAEKHVLTEKPMALNEKEAQKMVQVYEETDQILMVTLQSRYEPEIQYAKKFAQDNFGEIYYGRCGYLRRKGIPGWGSWFTKKEEAGGGPCADIGVHVLDRCLFLMDYPEPAAVTASTYSKFGPKGLGKGGWGFPNEEGDFNVEDLASAHIRFANGATVVLEASWALNRPNQHWVEVMGTKGGVVQDSELNIYMQENDNVDLNVEADGESGGIKMSRHFIKCCKTGQKPDTSPEKGLILNKIFDAVYQSGSNDGKQILLN